jgi:hypothetical protein
MQSEQTARRLKQLPLPQRNVLAARPHTQIISKELANAGCLAHDVAFGAAM